MYFSQNDLDDLEKLFFPKGIPSSTIIVKGEENIRKVLKITLGDFLRKDIKAWGKNCSVPDNVVLRILERYKSPVKSQCASDYVPKVLYPLAKEILSDNGFVYDQNAHSWQHS